jgi:UDP-GlcNAc:undecaprenyl-phosphate GlcNAc-1-phosphate transferase
MEEGCFFAAAFLATVVGVPILRWLFLRLNWIHSPRSDRWNAEYRRPVAMGGGVGIFLGLATGAFLLGLWDDLKNCRPIVRLLLQGLIAFLAVYWVGTIQGLPKLISLPLTVFGIVGLMNSSNLMDNMDGTASGLVGLAMIGYLLLGIISDDPLVRFLSLVVGGASFGFWLYNRPPAMIFMGDAGSNLLGFFLVITGVLATYSEYPHWFARWASPLLPAGLFITDTTFVVLFRRSQGRRISQGGKDHLSHRLALCFGGSVWKANGVLYLLQLLLGILAGVIAQSSLTSSLVLFLLAVGGLYGLGRKLWPILPESVLVREKERV